MQLRPYQQEAHDSIFEEWNKGVQKTLLVLPTVVEKQSSLLRLPKTA